MSTQTRRYRARQFDNAAACAPGDGPPCDHGPECAVRYLWPFPDETQDEFIARLTWTYSGQPQEAQQP